MRLLAISGSLRRASTNTAALEALARLAPEGVKVLVYGDLAKLPPFNPDDDVEDRPKPEPVETLRALVGASDAIVIAAPEYAHGVPGVLKNALDWLVASETFAGKPVALINTSPRAFHAQASLTRDPFHDGSAPDARSFRGHLPHRNDSDSAGHPGRPRLRRATRRNRLGRLSP